MSVFEFRQVKFMDRREALKKLGAGTAISGAGSLILSSRDVAHAMSHGGTGLSGAPANGSPPPFYFSLYQGDKKIDLRLMNPTAATCTGGGSPTVSYQWTLQSSTPSPPTFVVSNTSSPTTTLSLSGVSANEKFTTANKYIINVQITWQCAGAAKYLRAVYRLTDPAVDTTGPSVQQISWAEV